MTPNRLDSTPSPILWGEELSQWLECIQPDGGPVAMLRASIDESGTHGGDPVLCVAACLATPTQWRHFVDEWRIVLSTLPDDVEHYHAKDPRCRPVSAALVRLMARRLSTVQAVTLRDSEYKRATSDRYRSFVGGSYATAVQSCLVAIGHWCERNSPQMVAYTIESGHRGQAHVDKLLTSFASDPGLRKMVYLASHTWVPKGELIVDPADFVTYEVSAYAGEDEPPSLRPLGDKFHWHHLTEETIRSGVADVESAYKKYRWALAKDREASVRGASSPSPRRTLVR